MTSSLILLENFAKTFDIDLEIFDKGDYLLLRELWIPEKYRNTGIGSKLLEILEMVAYDYQSDKIKISNVVRDAIKFYKRNGYKWIPRDGTCNMIKEL
jgi:GNAT superfamily N-acetyltransferase